MLIAFTILPIAGYQWIDNDNSMFAFITIYCLGANIKKYNICFKKSLCILLFAVLLVLDCLSVIIQNMINRYPWSYVWGLKFPVAMTALFMFLALLNTNFKNQKVIKVISKLSAYVFGVYLFHDGGLLPLILDSLSINDELLNYWYYPVYMIFSAIIIFIAGVFVDYIWKRFFESNITNKVVLIIQKINKQH